MGIYSRSMLHPLFNEYMHTATTKIRQMMFFASIILALLSVSVSPPVGHYGQQLSTDDRSQDHRIHAVFDLCPSKSGLMNKHFVKHFVMCGALVFWVL